jgi:hypothetical protein
MHRLNTNYPIYPRRRKQAKNNQNNRKGDVPARQVSTSLLNKNGWHWLLVWFKSRIAPLNDTWSTPNSCYRQITSIEGQNISKNWCMFSKTPCWRKKMIRIDLPRNDKVNCSVDAILQ